MDYLKKSFDREKPNMPVIILFLVVLSVLTILFATGLGPVSVKPGTTARILISRIPGIGNSIPHTWEQLDQNIVLGLRLPRVCLGMVVGASLAVCGVTMQALVRNNLADPFILGVSSGAAAFLSGSVCKIICYNKMEWIIRKTEWKRNPAMGFFLLYLPDIMNVFETKR